MRLATKRQPSASNLMRSCDAASPCTNADVHYPKVERIRVVLDPCRRTQPMHSTRPFQLAGHAGTAGVPLCSQARQLVEHGRDRNQRALRPMPQLSDRRHRLGSEILAWQRQRMPHTPASNRYSQSTRLAQKWAAPIPANPISGAPNSKSHNHCPGLVGVTLMMLQWLEDIAAVLIGCGACDFPSRVDRLLPSSISLSAAT